MDSNKEKNFACPLFYCGPQPLDGFGQVRSPLDKLDKK